MYEGGSESRFYHRNGQRHCTDAPARIDADGSQFWYLNGLPHRTDGLAYISADGEQQ